MAFTTEFVMGAGGGEEIERLGPFAISGAGDNVLHTFSLDSPAFVSAVLGKLITSATGNWSSPGPRIEIIPTSGEAVNGLNAMSASPPVGYGAAADNAILSVAGILPSGEYRVIANLANSGRELLGGLQVIVSGAAVPERYAASGASEDALTPDRGVWTSLDTHVVEGGSPQAMLTDVAWSARVSNLYVSGNASRILLNGSPIWSRNGSGHHSAAIYGIFVKPGDVFSFDVYAGSTVASQRQVNSWSWSLS